MVALGLVTTEHLEGKMAYAVLHFGFSSELFTLGSAAKRNWWLLWGAMKHQVKCYLCKTVLFQSVWLCFASHHTAQPSRHENCFCSQQQQAWHKLTFGLTQSSWSIKGYNNWRLIVKQKAFRGSHQCRSGWRVSKVRDLQWDLLQQAGPLPFPHEMGFYSAELVTSGVHRIMCETAVNVQLCLVRSEARQRIYLSQRLPCTSPHWAQRTPTKLPVLIKNLCKSCSPAFQGFWMWAQPNLALKLLKSAL